MAQPSARSGSWTWELVSAGTPNHWLDCEVIQVAVAQLLGVGAMRAEDVAPRGIFWAQHGSWNRTTPVGARVMFTALDPETGDAVGAGMGAMRSTKGVVHIHITQLCKF